MAPLDSAPMDSTADPPSVAALRAADAAIDKLLEGRHIPGVEEQVVRLWLEGWSTIRRRLLILACVVAVLLPQGGVLQALLDPRPGLGDSGRALLVANLIVAVAWAVFLVALRPRDRGAG